MVTFLGIVGSPRAGNTEFIVKEILDKLTKMGAETRLFLLRQLSFTHCQGCWKCYKTKVCKMRDDLTINLFPEMISAQGMVFASPAYNGSVTGLMKNFMDRCTPFLNSYNPGPLRGKVSANIIVYGREGGVYCSQSTLDYWCLTMGLKVINNSLFHYLEKNDARSSIYREDETNIISLKMMASVDKKWEKKDGQDFPRIIVKEKALMPLWRTPSGTACKKKEKKGITLSLWSKDITKRRIGKLLKGGFSG